MYLYSITINIEDGATELWLPWMKTKIAEILLHEELVKQVRVLRILSEALGNGSSYSFQYHLPSEESIETFDTLYNSLIANEMLTLYKDRFVEFRTPLQELNW